MASINISRLRGIVPLLRIFTLVAAAITTIILGAACSVSQEYNESYADPWLEIFTLPFPLYSLVWCAIALLILLFKGPYHPGIDVGFDLVGWLANWGWSWLVFVSAVWSTYDRYNYMGESEADKARAHEQDRIVEGLLYFVGVLMVLYGATHLALFIMACKATHQRRMRKKRGYTIELDDVAPLKNNAAAPQ